MSVILVVDPDAPLRDLLREVLEREGNVVHEAATSEDATRLFREQGPASFQLIMADPEAPGQENCGGYYFVASLRARYPNMKFLFLVSRGGPTNLNLPLILRGEVPVLEKPFTPAELRAAVNVALALA